jgi:hypothetical protein
MLASTFGSFLAALVGGFLVSGAPYAKDVDSTRATNTPRVATRTIGAYRPSPPGLLLMMDSNTDRTCSSLIAMLD